MYVIGNNVCVFLREGQVYPALANQDHLKTAWPFGLEVTLGRVSVSSVLCADNLMRVRFGKNAGTMGGIKKPGFYPLPGATMPPLM